MLQVPGPTTGIAMVVRLNHCIFVMRAHRELAKRALERVSGPESQFVHRSARPVGEHLADHGKQALYALVRHAVVDRLRGATSLHQALSAQHGEVLR